MASVSDRWVYGRIRNAILVFAFAIETVARVRTLGLVEVVFAQIITRRIFRQTTTAIEWLGMAMIVAGVAIALNG